MPASAGQLGGQLSRDLPGQFGHPAIGDRGGLRQAPRHTLTLPRSSRADPPVTMHEVASGHVEAHTTGHGSHLLVNDRPDDLQTSLEAGGEVLLLTDEEED